MSVEIFFKLRWTNCGGFQMFSYVLRMILMFGMLFYSKKSEVFNVERFNVWSAIEPKAPRQQLFICTSKVCLVTAVIMTKWLKYHVWIAQIRCVNHVRQSLECGDWNMFLFLFYETKMTWCATSLTWMEAQLPARCVCVPLFTQTYNVSFDQAFFLTI